jgi:hypothetical protein
MSEAPGELPRRPLIENIFYGALVVIGLTGATAALIASTRPSDKGWTVVVGLVIAMVFGVTLAVAFYVWLLTNIIVPRLNVLVMLIKQDKASGLIPTLLATAQLIFIGATNEILNGDPALRWALSAILAALSLFGFLFTTLHKNILVTFVGVGMVIVSAGVVIFSAFTNHHWWSNYLSLSVGNQIAIAGAIGISIVILVATPIGIAQNRTPA